MALEEGAVFGEQETGRREGKRTIRAECVRVSYPILSPCLEGGERERGSERRLPSGLLRTAELPLKGVRAILCNRSAGVSQAAASFLPEKNALSP